jgi:hypothetical protein
MSRTTPAGEMLEIVTDNFGNIRSSIKKRKRVARVAPMASLGVSRGRMMC